ncbi:epidermal differentiation-specific protein-like [Astyanax mexicanus]|uniref:epidermal differentiation-specific protein-like n=1 Tax=Astyanax mexicanus TaxID=7994 RepID=UPI0020CB47FE|nr:epidermal differentiation-specific protein-like [Astyanax mexicanus]
MNKIIVYEHADFKGISREFTRNVPNLSDENFDECISSMIVNGNPWVIYSDANFGGYQYIFEEGHYPTVDWDNSTSSLEMVTEDLTDPQITLYDEPNYEGKSIVLTCETNLLYGSFNDTASSHKVQRGAWVLYQHKNRGGVQMLARASHDTPDYEWFSNRLTHLRPLKSGKPVITPEVLWEQKEERVNSVAIDAVCGVNCGSREQTFSTALSREYMGSVTESFKFSNATQISIATKFSLNLGSLTPETKSTLSNTFTVELGKTNTRTETNSITVTLPATIPPHTKLTVRVIKREVNLRIPVKLTITTGFHQKTEYGEFLCCSGNSITTEYEEERL